MHLDRRAIGRFAHPDVEIFSLSSLEKEYIIAVIQLGELIKLIQLGFGIELRIFAAVREEGIDIVKEMSVAAKKMIFTSED